MRTEVSGDKAMRSSLRLTRMGPWKALSHAHQARETFPLVGPLYGRSAPRCMRIKRGRRFPSPPLSNPRRAVPRL
jgi:hypothetical protein